MILIFIIFYVIILLFIALSCGAERGISKEISFPVPQAARHSPADNKRMVIKIQTKEQTDELVQMSDVFLMEHAKITPDAVWVGEIPYTRESKLLGFTFRTEKRYKKVRLLAWRLDGGITGRTWVLENPGLAVQTGRFEADFTRPIGWLLNKEQSVQYVDTHGVIDSSYCQRVIEALHRS